MKADEWCREQYVFYDQLLNEMMDLQRINDPTEIERAKIKRLQEEVDVADMKASLADIVKSIMKTESKGNMIFKVPSIHLDVSITW